MSIELRCMLTVDKKFEGGLELPRGTMVYAYETPSGWIGMYYPSPLQATRHSFALELDEFSIMRDSDTQTVDLIAVPPPPDPPEKYQAELDLARRRVLSRIEYHRAEADRLESALQDGTFA